MAAFSVQAVLVLVEVSSQKFSSWC